MQILTTNLTSLPVHMRLFSLSMRSLFTDKAVGSSSSTAGRFRELRDRTRNDAVAYLQGVLPVVKGCVADIIEYFEYYEFLSMDEWWENIHIIIEETKGFKEACHAVIRMHEEMMTDLNIRQDEAKILVSEMSLSGTRFEQMVDECKASSDSKQKWAIALAFVPVVNIVATPLLFNAAKKDLEESVAHQKNSGIEFAAAKVVSEVLVPALQNFIDALNQIAGFFEVVHEAHIAFQRRGEAVSALESPKILHYKMMRSKAGEIKGHCNKFFAVLPAIRADFEAIPREGTDQNYVDRWLEKQKKIINDHCTVRALALKMIKAIAPPQGNESRLDVDEQRKELERGHKKH